VDPGSKTKKKKKGTGKRERQDWAGGGVTRRSAQVWSQVQEVSLGWEKKGCEKNCERWAHCGGVKQNFKEMVDPARDAHGARQEGTDEKKKFTAEVQKGRGANKNGYVLQKNGGKSAGGMEKTSEIGEEVVRNGLEERKEQKGSRRGPMSRNPASSQQKEGGAGV